MFTKAITSIQQLVAEPYLVGLPFGLSAWEVTLPVGGINFLCGWEFRDADGNSQFFVSANGMPAELSKDAAIRHAREWEFASFLGEDYRPSDCWEEPNDNPADEPDFEEEEMDWWTNEYADWAISVGRW